MEPTPVRDQVAHSEQHYRRFFESAHDGILILDSATGKIVDVNPFLLTLLGYREEELLGKQPWEIGIFADFEANDAALKELHERGYIHFEDLPLANKSHDQLIDVEFVSNVYREGEREVIQCNIRDIRPRKAATDAASLEAQRVSRMKNEFLAMVAHELRTPLHAVLGWAQVLRRSKGNPDHLAAGLDAIMRSARVQSRLVEDLLDVSRIVFGKLFCDLRPLDVVNVVSDAINTARPLADGKRIEIKWTDGSREVVVNGDAPRLYQVFDNILSNAIKFTDPAGMVSVSIHPREPEVEIRILDTGSGIAPELLPFIFDRFRQSDGPAGHKQSGLGLGLAIVKEIVTLHGGKVKAASDGRGCGTTMSVFLPML